MMLRSVDYKVIVNELLVSFVITANVGSGVATPVDVRVPCDVLAQMLGLTTQARIARGVVSVI